MKLTPQMTEQGEALSHGQEAATVLPVGPDEAVELATTELDRFLVLLDSLDRDDWEKPTYCTRWNVRQVVSHLAGETAIFADRDEVLERSNVWMQGKADEPGQSMAILLADQAGMPPERRQAYRDVGVNPLDALNQFEVDERVQVTPEDLIAELRAIGSVAIANRRHLPDALRSLQLPMGTGARAPLHFLMDVILPRDMWMHRMEIALATDREIVRTADHEGRLTALVMRDLSRSLTPVLESTSVAFTLTGPDGGTFRFGSEMEATTLIMDTVDFHLLASGRLSPGEAQSRRLVTIDGDTDLAALVLAHTTVPY